MNLSIIHDRDLPVDQYTKEYYRSVETATGLSIEEFRDVFVGEGATGCFPVLGETYFMPEAP